MGKKAGGVSYQEILARRDRRKRQEHMFANKRPPIPHSKDIAWTIMILQWTIDELFKQWKELEIAKAPKTVLPPGRGPKKRGRGGRRNPVFEALGLD